MKIIHGIGQIKESFPAPFIALGVFDGLHKGHQKLIQYAVKKACVNKGSAIVMTFWPHPVQVLRPDLNLPLIVSLQHRIQLIETLGIDVCILVHFTKKFSKQGPIKFIKNYLVKKIHPKEIIVGDDFRFGQDRTGTIEIFQNAGKKFGFKVHTIKTKSGGEKTISSTRIRQLISQGKLKKAERLLNRRVAILGKVIRGEGRGKSLGYPTANLRLDGVILPPLGVYITTVYVNMKMYRGIANIGFCPSVRRLPRVSIEVHIFDFKRNLYGKEILVEFIKKIRDEKRFHSLPELVTQIQKDEQKARNLIAKLSF